MKLKEFEAKQLLEKSGINISKGTVIEFIEEVPYFSDERLVKVQSLAGGRGKAGGIVEVSNTEQAKETCGKFLGKSFLNEQITEILLDEKLEIDREFYLGIMFDTSKKCPVIIFSQEGGMDIEELKKNDSDKIILREIDYIKGVTQEDLVYLTSNVNPEIVKDLNDNITKIYDCFVRFDCKMIEINPLIFTQDQQLVAVDGVIVLDDNANFRREISFPERTGLRQATEREIAARKIDKEDHRGVAGKTFLDLDGDIAILASGGGASITLMDTLLNFGGKPANYTEYSGDPPAEKVEKLTRLVLDKKGLSGLLIAGVIANFTNVAETMKGILAALEDIKPKFPIVVRRAGPHDKEARQMLMKAKEDFSLDIYYYDESVPLTKAAEIIVQLSERYKNDNLNR